MVTLYLNFEYLHAYKSQPLLHHSSVMHHSHVYEKN